MDKNQLPTRLRELRKLNHYSQEFVASFLNISRQAYSHYETGRNTPPTDILAQLAQFYSLPVGELLPEPFYFSSSAGTNDLDFLDDFLEFFSRPNNSQKYQALTKNEKLLIYLYQKLPREDQTDFLDFLKIRAKHFMK